MMNFGMGLDDGCVFMRRESLKNWNGKFFTRDVTSQHAISFLRCHFGRCTEKVKDVKSRPKSEHFRFQRKARRIFQDYPLRFCTIIESNTWN